MGDFTSRCNKREHDRHTVIVAALAHPPKLPRWFARQFSLCNPHAATRSSNIAIRALFLERPHLLPFIPALDSVGGEILIRNIRVTSEQLSLLMELVGTDFFVRNFAATAWQFASQFAEAIGCRLEATTDGWMVYSQSERDRKLVNKFLRSI